MKIVPLVFRAVAPAYGFRKPGDIWYAEDVFLMFVTPNHREVHLDARWDVRGTPPNITVSPSIRCYGSADYPEMAWHGYIRSGQIETD